jgi:hypothetical protein
MDGRYGDPCAVRRRKDFNDLRWVWPEARHSFTESSLDLVLKDKTIRPVLVFSFKDAYHTRPLCVCGARPPQARAVSRLRAASVLRAVLFVSLDLRARSIAICRKDKFAPTP